MLNWSPPPCSGTPGVFAVLAWQAKRGQSVLHPDAPTLVAFGTVAALTMLAAVTAARRRPLQFAAVDG